MRECKCRWDLYHLELTADIIVWDYEKKERYATFKLHKVKVEAVAFSPGEHFLVSLGGRDDNSVAIWDLAKKEAVCGSPAAMKSAGCVFAVAFANQRDDIFVTGGDKTLRIWELDVLNRKIRPTDANLGQLKRVVKCLQVDNEDQFVFCGTTSGDVLQVYKELIHKQSLCVHAMKQDTRHFAILADQHEDKTAKQIWASKEQVQFGRVITGPPQDRRHFGWHR
jgi:WD40 repeat protein